MQNFVWRNTIVNLISYSASCPLKLHGAVQQETSPTAVAGAGTEEEIEACYQACTPEVVMHTNSTYPCPPEDLNMNYLLHLKEKYPAAIIGYSGHEYGLVTTFGAVALGARYVRRLGRAKLRVCR